MPRRVKIVCTLGPTSQSPEKIRELVTAGMDVARLNFSHGSHEFHASLIRNIRSAARDLRKNVAILQDLQGPKLRIGKLGPAGLMAKAGDEFMLYPEGGTVPTTTKKNRIAMPVSSEIAQAIAKDVKVGARILFDDGKVMSTVIEKSGTQIVVAVDIGGKLSDHKGMNLPGTPLSISCLMEKDLADLKFGLDQGVDAIALSFVRQAEDIQELRGLIKKHGQLDPLIYAKIEREEAIQCQDGIIDEADGLLIARGDMAVEIGADRVPVVQKQLIKNCNELGVPIITATQMLESMISSPTPTRAEANDVANAVFDGTDAVMLSGETASGQYPIETVSVMAKIILEAERNREAFSTRREILPMPGSVVESIEFSASRIATHVGAAVIACVTHSGMAARSLSKFRPDRPIVAIMENEANLRKLAFHWGVQGILIPKIEPTDDFFHLIEKPLMDAGWVQLTDTIVVTAGIPTLRRGTTNMIKVHRVGVVESR